MFQKRIANSEQRIEVVLFVIRYSLFVSFLLPERVEPTGKSSAKSRQLHAAQSWQTCLRSAQQSRRRRFGQFGHLCGEIAAAHLLFHLLDLFWGWRGHAAANAEHLRHLGHGPALARLLPHHLHHVSHLAMLFEKLVEIFHFHAGASGNALLAGCFQNIGIAPLQRGH